MLALTEAVWQISVLSGGFRAQTTFQPPSADRAVHSTACGRGGLDNDARRQPGPGGHHRHPARRGVRPVSRRGERQPERRRIGADLRMLERRQPALDGDRQRPADRLRQQVPGCSRPRHDGRYPGADLDLQRQREPAVEGQRRRHDRRRRVRAVPGRHRLGHGQRHGRGDLDVQRPQQPTVDRPVVHPDHSPDRDVRPSLDVPLDLDRGARAAGERVGVGEGLHRRGLQRQAPGLRVQRQRLVVRVDDVQPVHQLVGHGVRRAERDGPGRGGAHAVLLRPDQPQRLVRAAAPVHRQHPRRRPDRPDPDRRRPEHVPVLRRRQRQHLPGEHADREGTSTS